MIPKALGDALTQDSMLGGWRKAGLTEEGYAHVLHGLPAGKRIGPQTSYPYIAGRILTTNSTIKEIREWFMKRKHQDTSQSQTTPSTQIPSPAKALPSSPASPAPSTPEESQESTKTRHRDLRKTAYKSPSFYTSDNFPMTSSALADRVTRPSAVIMIDSDSEQEAHPSSTQQTTTTPSQQSSTVAPEPSTNSSSSNISSAKTHTSTIPPLSTPPPSDSDSDWGYHHNQLHSPSPEELVLTKKDGRMMRRRTHRPQQKGSSSTDTDSDKQPTTPETRQTPATPPPPPQNPQAAPTPTPKKTRKGLKATDRPVIELVNPPPSSDSPRKKIEVDWNCIDQNSDDSSMADDEDLYVDLGPETDGVTDAVDDSEEESSDSTQTSSIESSKLQSELHSQSTPLSKESTLSLYMSLNSNDSTLFDTVMDRESI